MGKFTVWLTRLCFFYIIVLIALTLYCFIEAGRSDLGIILIIVQVFFYVYITLISIFQKKANQNRIAVLLDSLAGLSSFITIIAIITSIVTGEPEVGIFLIIFQASFCMLIFAETKERRRLIRESTRSHQTANTHQIRKSRLASSDHSLNPLKFKDLSNNCAAGLEDMLNDLHDAFTGEPLKSAITVYQCTHCKVCYLESSVAFLHSQNGSKCISCLLAGFIVPLTKESMTGFGANYSTETVTVTNYHNFIGRVVKFEGCVLMVSISQIGHGYNYDLIFENKPRKDALKMVIFAHSVEDIGGARFLNNLQGKTVTIRGLLQKTPLYGPEIIVTKRQMILEIK